jgi:hypothetical protein
MDDRITDEPPGDIPPWELPGGFRLDCEPHRGPFLQGSAFSAIAALLVSCGLAVLALFWFALTHGRDGWVPEMILACVALASAACSSVALALGLSVQMMARRDLGHGWMGPGGRQVAERARDMGQVAFGLAAGVMLFWALILLLVLGTDG